MTNAESQTEEIANMPLEGDATPEQIKDHYLKVNIATNNMVEQAVREELQDLATQVTTVFSNHAQTIKNLLQELNTFRELEFQLRNGTVTDESTADILNRLEALRNFHHSQFLKAAAQQEELAKAQANGTGH